MPGKRARMSGGGVPAVSEARQTTTPPVSLNFACDIHGVRAGAHEDMEGAFLARARHLVALQEAQTRLAAASHHLDAAPAPLELFAEELRAAQMALGAITGEFTADDLLGAIFSRFCIGK